MPRTRAVSLVAALAVVAIAVVAIAACSGGGNGHRARSSRATSTTAGTAPSSTSTAPASPSTTGRAPTPTAPPGAPTPSTARPGSVPSPQANCIAETPAELTSYLGLSLQGAQGLAASQGYHVRVVGSDGHCQAVSTELDPNRVDLYLDRGVVTAAGMG